MKRTIFSTSSKVTTIGAVVFSFVLFFVATSVAHAQAVPSPILTIESKSIPQDIKTAKDSILESLKKAAQVSFLNSLRSVVNQIAFETATYIGSGASGQKPLFYTEPFGKWILKQGDNAAGNFIETFSTIRRDPNLGGGGNQLLVDKLFASNYDICAPDLNITAKLSLALVDYTSTSHGLAESRCSLSKIYRDTSEQFDALYGGADPKKRQEYFKNLALGSFNPQTTDLGAAFNLFGLVGDTIVLEKQSADKTRTESAGWVDIVNSISGTKLAPPDTVKNRLTTVENLKVDNFGKQTGNIFADAANIFLNQLALSAFNRLMETLGKNSSGGGNVSNYTAQGSAGGVTELQQKAKSVLQARFNERTDYDILAQLSSCTNPEKPGPTNCVITQQFAQAIEKGMTVAQALDPINGYLDGSKRIGYDERGNEMSFNDGYPYRSLIILRKYRILPVGWEVAAQYIKENSQATKDVTLNDLIACFSADDDEIYPGYEETWCRGLIDPSWTLKLPKMFCGMEGYGSELMSAIPTVSSTGYCAVKASANCGGTSQSSDCNSNYQACSNDDDCDDMEFPDCNFSIGRDVELSRNDSYCADERSCIKENANGSCAYYGYCTQEKRRWVFNEGQDNACEARNNTCQSFRSDSGSEVSYLQNTLNYDNCGANQVGCKQYATTGTYTTSTAKVAWNAVNSQRYFNRNMTDCDPSSEGCHEFVRSADNLDTNLMADGSFESSVCVQPAGGSETKLPNDKNPLIESANAQLASGCILSTMSASGYLPSPNSRWYINVSSGSVKAGIAKDFADHGANSLYIEGNGGLYSDTGSGAQLLPLGFSLEPERFYTLTAVVRPIAGKVKLGFGLGAGNGQFAESTVTDTWQNLVVNYYAPTSNIPNNIYIIGSDASAKFYVDSVKLSIGQTATLYNEYYSNNRIYEKLLPPYLEVTCYQNPGSDYKLKTNAPPVCFDFARKCNADEVGCKKYISSVSGIEVTAKTKPKDFCPNSCVGYNVFVQQANNFNAMQSAYFIPSTARSCSAQAVGCTAFTNLDKLAGGGEAVEYFSYMRSCMKPDALSCDSFYTWEGSDESGYQLKTFSLKKNGSEPASTMSAAEEALVCNADVFKKSPSEPGFNYDCREFYARDGTVSYHLYSRTISCSDDCHPYRREVASSAICTAGGGTWDATQSRCLHYAIPSEGTTCAAAQVGCQEYTGNVAGNIRTIFVNGFENASNPTDGWGGGNQSNTALNLGGHSLQTFQDITLSKTVGSDVERNFSYTISFLAKSQSNTTSVNSIDFINKDNETAVFETSGSSISSSEWRLYTFNLATLNHDVTPIDDGAGNGPGGPQLGEKLRIKFNAPVYVDNIRLTAVPNRYYLIKDSWQTPDECDQDMNGDFAPRFMLGCSQYKDVDNQTVNLHSFSQLCQDSAAGCEQMIDTNNSSDNRKRLYNDTNGDGTCGAGEDSCVEVPADTMINVVFDKTKFCNSAEKGCSRLGQGTKYDGVLTFSDVYKRNNPDTYNTTICSSGAVGCSQYSDKNGGTVYFKDPGNEVCEWRIKDQTNGQYGWFKKKVNRCGGVANGALCSTNSDCGAGQSCTLYNADIVCDSDSMKTIGVGGSTGRVTQPSQWAGSCDAQQSGCTEYIEPISKINENLILNASFNNLDTDTGIEYWTNAPTPANTAQQNVSLRAQTIYILKGDIRSNPNPPVSVKITCDVPNTDGQGLRVLDTNNNFTLATNDTTEETIGLDKSIMFYVQVNSNDPASNVNQAVSCTIQRSNSNASATNHLSEGVSVFLRQAIVDYQLAQNLDRTSHNGLVNNDKGAVLFNERTQAGTKKAPLLYNADGTYDTPPSKGDTPKTTQPRNANVILQVKPDRICSQWLSCTTYLPDPSDPNRKTCLNVSLCDSLDANGGCNNFVTPPAKDLNSRESIANLTGYSKVGFAATVRGQVYRTMQDYYNLATMTQVGENVSILNGNFESKDTGWIGSGVSFLTQPGQISQENLSQFQPVKGQATADFIVPEGQGILKVGSEATATQNEAISLNSGSRYVLNFYSYSKGSGLKVKLVNDNNPSVNITLLEVGSIDPQNKWVKQAIGFQAASSTYKIVIEKTGGGDAYIDDMRLEVGLNTRCTDDQANQKDCVDPVGHCSSALSTECHKNSDCPTNQSCIISPQVGNCSVTTTRACIKNSDCTNNETCIPPTARPQYAGSSCRLYPKENSLACLYTDKDNVTHKGIRGYCLENDPKDPATCLLWYPVSRIAGDTTEEGTNVNFGQHGTYYCIDAVDACGGPNNETPGFYCNQFVKVDTDHYWNRRISQGSSFKLPDETVAYKRCSISNAICTVDANCPAGQTCINGPQIFPVSPIFWPTAQMTIDFGGKGGPKVNLPALRWGFGNGYFASYQPLTDFNINQRQVMQLTGTSISSFIPYYGASNGTKCPGPNQGNLTCAKFSGDEEYFLGAYTSGDKMIDHAEGWDVCVPSVTASLDEFDEDPIFPPSKIDEVFGWTSCSFSDTTANHYECMHHSGDNKCGNGNDHDKKCETQLVGDRSWKLIASDLGNNDEVGCVAYCFNRTKEFKIANPEPQAQQTGVQRALDAIRRLYPMINESAWRVFKWVSNVYQESAAPTSYGYTLVPCANGVRPYKSGIFGQNQDYCFIDPKVNNIKVNGLNDQDIVVNGSADVTLSFETQTDPEQLPLKNITIKWGYSDGSGEKKYELNGNMADVNPRQITHRYDYYALNSFGNTCYSNFNSICQGAEFCCEAIPNISITDNWGRVVDEQPFGHKVIVKKPQ